MNHVPQQLLWVAAGTIMWFGIKAFYPKAAGAILLAFVVYAIVQVGDIAGQLGIGNTNATSSAGGW